MTYTKLVTEFYVPTTSISRVQDCLKDIVAAVEAHKGVGIDGGAPFVTIQGPYSDGIINSSNGGTHGQAGSRNGLERGRKVATNGDEDLPRDTFQGEDGADTGTRGSADTGTGADQPKRGRGRPRKSADGDGGSTAQAGSSSGERDRGRSSSRSTEDDGGNEPVGTREGSGKADREGKGRDGGSERSRDDQRGNRQASRVTESDEWGGEDEGGEWADEEEEDPELVAARSPGDTNWPDSLTPKDIDKTVLSTLLGDHYKATGGKDRAPTFELMESVTGVRQISQIDEDDYVKLAKALLKDAARYRFGIKKPK